MALQDIQDTMSESTIETKQKYDQLNSLFNIPITNKQKYDQLTLCSIIQLLINKNSPTENNKGLLIFLAAQPSQFVGHNNIQLSCSLNNLLSFLGRNVMCYLSAVNPGIA